MQDPAGLQTLTVLGSMLIGIEKGLFGCTCLADLNLEACTFDASIQPRCLCIGPGMAETLVPEQLSKLTA